MYGERRELMAGRLSVLLVLMAAILWGTTGTAQYFAPNDTSPLAIGAVRLLIGGIVLLLYVMIQRKLVLSDWPIGITIVAAASMAAYQPLFFSAVSMTGVAIGTVIAIGSAPILAGMLEYMLHRKIPSIKWWAATILAIIGCSLLFLSSEHVRIDIFGITLAVGAGISFAIYTLVSKKLLTYKHPPEAIVAVIFSLAAILLAPVLLFQNLSWLIQPIGLVVAIHLGVIATAIAYILFVTGLKGTPASTAVTLSLAEPLTAALLGVFIVGEVLTFPAVIGIGLVFFGLSLVTYESRKDGD